MRIAKYIIISLLIYLVFLVMLFPANVALSLVTLPKGVQISGVTGTIWSGAVNSLTVQKRQLDSIRWQLHPWSLLSGSLDVDLTVGHRTSAVNGKANIDYSMAGITVNNLRFEAPNQFVIGQSRLPFKTKIAGESTLMLTEFKQGQPWCEQLNGKLFLTKTQVNNQFGDYPLGDIELKLTCQAGAIQISTDETMNKLGLVGQADLADKSRVKLAAKIRSTATQPADLQKALSFLGEPDAQGYYPINYNGRVPGL